MVLSSRALTRDGTNGPFRIMYMEAAKAFEEFSTPINYNQIIMYTATLQRMLLIIILYVHTL
jgi:hypothetical protein